MPTPADLARARPKPPTPTPTPQQPTPKGRIRADIEKERALRALWRLVADPATDFAALPDDEFFAALKCACQDGIANPAMVADAERRITSGESGPRELHQVLFVAGDRRAWGHVRARALEAAVRDPAMAVSVVSTEAQRLGVAGMRVTESEENGMFTATASLERDGTRVEGRQRHASNKKAARQAAALSLLGKLAGLTELTGLAGPDHEPDRGPTASAPTGTGPRLTVDELELWLDHEVGKPKPDPELLGLVQTCALSVRSLYLLLFEADPQGWAEARAVAWEALISAPSTAGGVLSLYSQTRSWPRCAISRPGSIPRWRSCRWRVDSSSASQLTRPVPGPRGRARPWRCSASSLSPPPRFRRHLRPNAPPWPC